MGIFLYIKKMFKYLLLALAISYTYSAASACGDDFILATKKVSAADGCICGDSGPTCAQNKWCLKSTKKCLEECAAETAAVADGCTCDSSTAGTYAVCTEKQLCSEKVCLAVCESADGKKMNTAACACTKKACNKDKKCSSGLLVGLFAVIA